MTKDVKSLDEFKELTLGSNGPNGIRAIEALGATPVLLQPEEFQTGLQQGMVDGIVYVPDLMLGRGIAEVVDYMEATPLFTIGNPTLLMNLDTWNGLSQRHQDIITDVMDDFKYDSKYYKMGKYKTDLDKIAAAGIETIEFLHTPAEVEWWKGLYTITTWGKLKERLSPERYNEVKGMLERAGYPEPEGVE